MCKNERINVLCKGIEYSARSEERLREVLKHVQRSTRKIRKGQTSSVIITNGMKTLEMFVGQNNIGGWEKNGGTREGPYYVRGIDGIVDVFKLSLA